MATVKVEQNAAGDYAIGVEIDGTFVKFAEVPAARVQQQQERAQDLQTRAESGDKTAQDAVSADYGGANVSWTDESKTKASK